MPPIPRRSHRAEIDDLTSDEPPLVLVIDDDEFVRKAMGRNLRRLGCEVLIATDGEEGLRIAADAGPAVVFLDLRMPGIDGHAVLGRLVDAGARASVVVMSGQGDMDDVIGAVRHGAVDYVKKPWTSNDLASALARGVQMFNARDQDETAGGSGGQSAAMRRTATPPGGHSQGVRGGAGGGGRGMPTQHNAGAPLHEIVQWLRSGRHPHAPCHAGLGAPAHADGHP